MSDFREYYQLQKESTGQYKRFVKALSNKTISRNFFTLSDGVLEPKRKKLHEDITDKYLVKYPSQSKPYIHFILGSIGSGKTSLKDTVVNQEEIQSFLYINFDELKRQLPEYEILKNINPKKAAHFVQSESAKLAGNLYKRAVKQKINIIYEKNIRLNTEGGLHLISEIKRAFQKNYTISVHVVFLDSYQEAWKRVRLRYEKIKRYVPKQYVKDTFEDLFSNLDILLRENFKKEYLVKLWYNGEWDKSFNMPKKAHTIGVISFRNKKKSEHQSKDDFILTFEGADADFYYCGFFLKKIMFLPKSAKSSLMKLKRLKKALSVLNL